MDGQTEEGDCITCRINVVGKYLFIVISSFSDCLIFVVMSSESMNAMSNGYAFVTISSPSNTD